MLYPTPPSKKTIRGVSRDTEVLTPQGFVNVTDVTQDTTLLQYHETGTLSFTQPCSPIDIFHYNGLAYHFSTRNKKIDQLITPEQRIPYTHKNTHGESVIKTTSCLDGLPPHTTNKVSNNYILGGHINHPDNQTLQPLEKIKLLATQHNISFRRSTPNYDLIYIRLHLKPEVDYVTTLLTKAGIPIADQRTTNLTKRLKRESTLLKVWLPKNIYSKNLEWVNIATVNQQWCQDFIETLITLKPSNNKTYTIKIKDKKEYTFKKHSHRVACKTTADKLQTIAYMAGYRTRMNLEQHTQDYQSYGLRFNPESHTVLVRSTVVKPVEYNDLMVRIKVPSGFLAIRRNNVMSITGG